MSKLRRARERRGFTQDDVAALSGVDQTTISYLEQQADPNPRWHTLRRLARALGVRAEDVMQTPSRRRGSGEAAA